MTKRVVVMVSGNGSNLQAIIDAQQAGRLPVELTCVISNVEEAFALTRAKRAGIPTMFLSHLGLPRADFDRELAYLVASVGADLVVLAGWNRLLGGNFVSHHTTINLHPAEPGMFPGFHAIRRAYEAWTAGKIGSGGVMVHYVPDEGVDDGPVIGWTAVPFLPGDSLEDYELRVHDAEHELLVDSINKVLPRLPPRGA